MSFWGVLGLLQKAYSLGFLLEDRHEGRQLPRVVVGDVLKRLAVGCSYSFVNRRGYSR